MRGGTFTGLRLVLAALVGACAESTSGADHDAEAGSDDATSGGTETAESGEGSSASTGTSDGSETEGTGESTESTTGDPPDGSPGCGMASPGAGVHARNVDVDGMQRSFELGVPGGYDIDVPTALVLDFHGLYGSPSQQRALSRWDEVGEARGILVAWPEGVGQSFNAGACCGEAAQQNVDDVAFARELVESVSADLCVDPRRVYATGMSNGGHMAHWLACEAADVFAAVAPVAGVLGPPVSECTPARPISVLDFHGTSDFVVAYGGAGPGFPAVPGMMQAWAARNGCEADGEVSFQQGDVTCETWPGCGDDVEVTLCTVDGGGHCWPGNPSCLFGSSTTDADASQMAADMFEAHPLP
jgi:polyhydroxybutyrate depolymerase